MTDNKIKELVKLAYKTLDSKKASDISVLDIHELSVIADYFIVASADNLRQTVAICDELENKLGKAGFECRQVEGRSSANWILMDYNDIIVHIFSREDRLFYDLERIWRDGKVIENAEEL